MFLQGHIDYLKRYGTTWLLTTRETATTICETLGAGYITVEFKRRKRDYIPPMGYVVQSLDFIQRQRELQNKGFGRYKRCNSKT